MTHFGFRDRYFAALAGVRGRKNGGRMTNEAHARDPDRELADLIVRKYLADAYPRERLEGIIGGITSSIKNHVSRYANGQRKCEEKLRALRAKLSEKEGEGK